MRPEVVAIVRLAEVLAVTAELVCDVAVTVRFREPGVAKLTALVVIGTTCDAPAASVTDVVLRLATSAAGPARLRLKVSVAAPVLVTVKSKVVPGAPGRRVERHADPAGQDRERAVGHGRDRRRAADVVAVTVNGTVGRCRARLRRERQGHVAEVARAGGHVDGSLAERGRDARGKSRHPEIDGVVAAAGVGQLHNVLGRSPLPGARLGRRQRCDDAERVGVGGSRLALEDEVALHRGRGAVVAADGDREAVVAGGGEGVGGERQWNAGGRRPPRR